MVMREVRGKVRKYMQCKEKKLRRFDRGERRGLRGCHALYPMYEVYYPSNSGGYM
jgi:hypothetical protein